MSALHSFVIRSPAELRAHADAWDALWQSSAVATPLMRAEAIAQWCEHFAPRAPLAAVVIADGSQFRAALPMVRSALAKCIACGKLPNDPWSISGDLLLTPGEEAPEIVARLIAELEQLAWPLWYFETIETAAPRWQLFCAQAGLRGWQIAQHEDVRFGCVTIRDWQAYEEYWSGNHRRNLRKALKRIDHEGGMQFVAHVNPATDLVGNLLQTGFEVEHRSWKADTGTSVLAVPGKQAYYQRLAEQMSDWGHLHLSLIEHQGWPIAFSLGLMAKGVYFAPKIGYDDAFSRFSPGQLLFYELLHSFHEQRLVESVDFWGPLTDATSKWITHDYARGRLILAPPRGSSRALFRALQTGRKYLRTVRQWRAQRNGRAALSTPEENLATVEA